MTPRATAVVLDTGCDESYSVTKLSPTSATLIGPCIPCGTKIRLILQIDGYVVPTIRGKAVLTIIATDPCETVVAFLDVPDPIQKRIQRILEQGSHTP